MANNEQNGLADPGETLAGDKCRYQIINGTIDDGIKKKSVGDYVTLPFERAKRLISLGIIAELELTKGYPTVEGKYWIRFLVDYNCKDHNKICVLDDEDRLQHKHDFKIGDAALVDDPIGASIIREGLAAKLQPATGTISFSRGL